MAGGNFTWSSTANTTSKSLFDRFLVNGAWDNQFHSITVSALAKPFSDHKPVCLVCDLEDWGPPPFRSEAMWFLDISFIPLLNSWWQYFSFSGPPGFVLTKKFQALKKEINI